MRALRNIDCPTGSESLPATLPALAMFNAALAPANGCAREIGHCLTPGATHLGSSNCIFPEFIPAERNVNGGRTFS
jgi:hypothetical protein